MELAILAAVEAIVLFVFISFFLRHRKKKRTRNEVLMLAGVLGILAAVGGAQFGFTGFAIALIISAALAMKRLRLDVFNTATFVILLGFINAFLLIVVADMVRS